MASLSLMRLAVIDLGTNTFNLLVVEINGKEFTPVFNTKRAVKIGEGALIAGKLLPEPINRGKATLAEYQGIISKHKCDKTFAFATSGIRSTSNGQNFVDEVKSEIGLDINIIDGEEEAQLIYDGVDLAIPFSETPSVVMDIGGGSTEFIIADNSGVLWKKSYKLGISRILQMLEPANPVSQTDLESLNKLLATELVELVAKCKGLGIKTLVGSSGSFDSFAEMLWAQKGVKKTTKEIVSDEFDLNEVSQLHTQLISSDWKTRSQIPGLVEMRVDTIHMASYFVQWVLENCGLERLLLSTYALKEGVVHRVMEDRL
ncbi:MAG: hypothetical protein ACPG5W_06315 [Flavobacteriales bacterium]